VEKSKHVQKGLKNSLQSWVRQQAQ
jgi:hypothetical protein